MLSEHKPDLVKRSNCHLEYVQKSKNSISLHFSFATDDQAWVFFEKMKNDWKMPVIVRENHVVLATAKNIEGLGKTGVVLSDANAQDLQIHFLTEEHANGFFDLDISLITMRGMLDLRKIDGESYVSLLNIMNMQNSLRSRVTQPKKTSIFALLFLF